MSASMDACARALLIAEKMIKDGALDGFVDERYAGWDGKEGKAILAGKTLARRPRRTTCSRRGLEPQPKSGKQEHLEGLLNEYL